MGTAVAATAAFASISAELERARGGEPAAFEALVSRHERMVYGLAVHVLHDPDKAEDVAQDVFLQMYRDLRQIESDAHLTFWLRRVTSHRAIDVARRARRKRHVALDEARPLTLVRRDGDPMLARRLRELVAGLPPHARTVIVLRYQEDLDPTEIAAVLGVPLNTVKSQLKRALAVLRGRSERLRDTRP
jgi:RNA polymerase sigma-70 factor (ECF subfamily)